MPLRHQDHYLDFIRGLSAQAVLIGHLTVLAFPAKFAEVLGDGRLGARAGQFHVQSYAVVVFLVLSGFLISRSVGRRYRAKQFSFPDYIRDRAARLLTPLLPAILFVPIADRAFLGRDLYSRFVDIRLDPWTIISNLLFLQDNIVLRAVDALTGAEISRRSLGSAAPLWTVAYEWWIYIAFGSVVALLARRTLRLRLVLPCLFAGATVFGVLLAGNSLVLAWAVGAIYGWGTNRALTRMQHGLVSACSITLLVAFLASFPGAVYAPVTTVATGVAILSARVALRDLPGLHHRAITFPAEYSYSLYLIHFPVLVWLVALCDGLNGWSVLALGFTLANVLAVAWWWMFERHYPSVRSWLGRLTMRAKHTL